MEEKDLRSGADDRIKPEFKILSAIGIFIIVSGHCYHGGISLAYEWFPIYSFNVSLFVFASGYFYKPTYEQSVLKYIWKRFKRLVIPAYLWNIAYGLFILLMKNFGYTIGGEVNAYSLFIMPFTDGEAFKYNLGSWFVYSLFLACVFNVLFRKLCGLVKIRNEFVFLAVYTAIGMFGIYLAIKGHNAGVAKLITRTMMFLPWLQLGRTYNAHLEKFDKLNSVAYFAILFGIQLLLITLYKNLEYAPSAMNSFNNGVIIPYVTSVTGIAFWLRISKLLAPIVKDNKLVRFISDNTYSIMIHQMFGFMVVKWIFYGLSLITDWIPGFNLENLRANIWYFYLPNKLQQYALIYVAGGIFVPILINTGARYLIKGCAALVRRIKPRKQTA